MLYRQFIRLFVTSDTVGLKMRAYITQRSDISPSINTTPRKDTAIVEITGDGVQKYQAFYRHNNDWKFITSEFILRGEKFVTIDFEQIPGLFWSRDSVLFVKDGMHFPCKGLIRLGLSEVNGLFKHMHPDTLAYYNDL